MSEYKKAITEELTGALSSQCIITAIGLTAGGAALLGEPITGSILLGASVFYGTILKVKAGALFDKKPKVMQEPKNKEVLLKTKSSRFVLIRYLSKVSPT
jgi:hypothetical protein